MKIERGSGAAPANASRKAASAAAPGFSVAADAPQRSAAAAPASAVTPLDAILALQTDEGPGPRRARQARRGRRALDALELLEEGLLTGRAPAGLRAELDSLQCASERTGDEGLDAILREIDTRLAVEAAKLDKMLGRV